MAQNLSPEQTPLVADLSQPAADSRLALSLIHISEPTRQVR